MVAGTGGRGRILLARPVRPDRPAGFPQPGPLYQQSPGQAAGFARGAA